MSQARDGAGNGTDDFGAAMPHQSDRTAAVGRTGPGRWRQTLLMRTSVVIMVAGLAGCESVSDTYDDVVGWLDGEDETAPPPANGGFQSASTVPPAPDETAEDRRQRLRRELAGDTPQEYSDQGLTAQGAQSAGTYPPPAEGYPPAGDQVAAAPTPAPTPAPAPGSQSFPAPQQQQYTPPPEPSGLQPLFGSSSSPQPAPQPQSQPQPAYPAPGTASYPPPAADSTAASPYPDAPVQSYPTPTQTYPSAETGAPQTASSGGYGVQPLFGAGSPQPAPAAQPQAPVPSQLPSPPAGMGTGMPTGGSPAGAAPDFGAGAPASDATVQNTTDPYLAYYGQSQPDLVPPEPSPTDAVAPQFDSTSLPQTASAAGTGPVPLQGAGQPTAAPPSYAQQVPSALPVQASPTTAFGSPIMNRRSPAPAAMGRSVAAHSSVGARMMQPVAATAGPVARAGQYFSGRPVKVGTIYFSNGSAGLSRDDVQVLRQIARLHSERGGLIQVVGHASHRTRQMDPMRHRLANFGVSLSRGAQIKRALQRMGIDAQSIAVAAESDSQPIYRESMPSGEAGNRRAEVFFVY